jgi:transglutaminase-like putative cysteine protease
MKPQTSFNRTLRLLSFPLLLAIVIASISPQRSGAVGGGEEWRPVDAADLALKEAVVEPNADAEAIFWDIRIDDGGEDDLVLNHYVRIKIFTERGRDKHSKIDIPYASGVKIKDVAARTIKPDGTILELPKEDIIEKMVVKVSGLKLRTKTFAFPGIEPGAIIEYKWKEVISHASAHNMRLQFQRDIPVQSITYRIKPAGKSDFVVRPFNMPRFVFQKEKNGFHSTTITKMAAFREEPMMPPADSVRAWAMVRYSDAYSWLSSYYFLATRIYFGWEPYMKVDDTITQKANEIVAGAKTPEEKLEKIFLFCRTNIKNTNDATSGFTEEQLDKLKENKKPSDTLKRGVGPGIDINLLFAALANAAGFETRVALLPDRGQRFFDKNELIPGALRPASIAVRNGQSWKFFDPGLQYISPGMLRWQEEGVDALIADSRPTWVSTPMSPPEKSKEKRTARLRLDENGTLEGDVTIEYTGHLAVERKLLNDEDSPVQREENLKEAVKGRLSSAELTNIVIENATDPTKPFIYKYHVRVPDYAQRTGKRLFFQPGFFSKGISALFSAGTRRYPVYFHFPWSEDDDISIALPKGYTLDNADRPAPIDVGNICKHEIRMGLLKNDAGTLGYRRTFFFGGNDSVLFPVGTYDQIKQLFDEINKADNHMITLKQGG